MKTNWLKFIGLILIGIAITIPLESPEPKQTILWLLYVIGAILLSLEQEKPK